MNFLLLALSIFFVSHIADNYVDAPVWMFALVKVGLAALGLWITGENPGWCLAVAGLVVVTEVTYALLLAVGDWCRVQILRNTRSR